MPVTAAFYTSEDSFPARFDALGRELGLRAESADELRTWQRGLTAQIDACSAWTRCGSRRPTRSSPSAWRAPATLAERCLAPDRAGGDHDAIRADPRWPEAGRTAPGRARAARTQ